MRRSDVNSVRLLLQQGAAVERYYLDQAALMGNADMVRVLLEHDGFDTQDRRSTLINAICTSQNVAVVRELLIAETASVNPNFSTHEQDTPLHLAVQSTAGTEILELLLECGADPDVPDLNGATPLHLVDHKHDQARILCRYGANTTLRDKQGFTPLHKACRAGHLHVVQELCLGAGADPNASIVADGGISTSNSTPLSLAIRFHHGDIVQFLIERAHANPRPHWGEPPLMAALMEEEGTTLLPSHLIRLGMDPYQLNASGDTVLHVALQHLRSENDNGGDEDMEAFSFYPANEYRLRFIDDLLASAPSLVHTRDASSRTALHVAAETCKISAVPLLHKHGADLLALDRYGRTPLHRAVMQCQSVMVECLVSLMHKLDTRDAGGWTSLHWAVFLRKEEMVRQLLLHGADCLHVRNYTGKTPLHLLGYALDEQRPPESYSDLDVCRVLKKNQFVSKDTAAGLSCLGVALVSRGADAVALDQDDNLPWFLAARSGEVGEVMTVLRAAASQGFFERLSHHKRKNSEQSVVDRKRSKPSTHTF
eukprot:scaffold1250_cov184-Amphora_coffeaeformis.AAC.1